jgi:hypothetical protein
MARQLEHGLEAGYELCPQSRSCNSQLLFVDKCEDMKANHRTTETMGIKVEREVELRQPDAAQRPLRNGDGVWQTLGRVSTS